MASRMVSKNRFTPSSASCLGMFSSWEILLVRSALIMGVLLFGSLLGGPEALQLVPHDIAEGHPVVLGFHETLEVLLLQVVNGLLEAQGDLLGLGVHLDDLGVPLVAHGEGVGGLFA